jgi:hypothetical protein
MEEVYASRKFIPGQIWNLTINLKGTINDDLKRRPYLIIASNNRRIVCLKMTSGGMYSTNWIYMFNRGNSDKDSNIILDVPIAVDICNLGYGDTYETTLSPDLFRKIMLMHYAAMLSQGLPELLDSNALDEIKAIMADHEDRMVSYSIYNMQYEFQKSTVDESNDTEDTEDIEETEPEDTTDIIEEDKVVTVSHTEAPIADKKFEAAPSSPKNDQTTTSTPTTTTSYRSNIKVEDLVIIGAGKTLEQKVFDECERLGIATQNAKFQLRQLESNGLSHTHDKYGCILKSNCKMSDYKELVESDVKTFGPMRAAKIWNRSKAGIRYYCK